MSEIKISVVNKKDLKELSKIYDSIYKKIDIGEYWTEETAFNLFKYFYYNQKDLFLVAYIDKQVVGAVMSCIKPYWDGNRLVDTEIFVDQEYQKLGIAKKLYIKHFEIAIKKYNVKTMEAHTYKDEKGFPFNWYQNINFKENKIMLNIEGDIKEALNMMKKQD